MKNKFFKYFSTGILMFTIIGCGSGGSFESSREQCSIENQNKRLYEYMKNWYFWEKDMTTISDFNNYKSMKELLSKIKVSEDKWSYILSQEEQNTHLSTIQKGTGLHLIFIGNDLKVSYVDKNSPAFISGIKRSFIIKKIDDLDPIKDREKIAYNLMTKDTFKISYTDGISSSIKETLIRKEIFDSDPILYSSIITQESLKIGYIVYSSFEKGSIEKLKKVFQDFKKEEINNIIFDLRYNGGGYLYIVETLGAMLSKKVHNKEAYKLIYNSKQQDSNVIRKFDNTEYFDFEKLIFITTKDSASSSEALINSLKPYVDVKLIGQNTHGKAVGMRGKQICTNYIYPIMFKIYNSENKSYSTNGITADCLAYDTVNLPFGDKLETMLKAGIQYIQNGICNDNSGFRKNSIEENFYFDDTRKFKNAIIE